MICLIDNLAKNEITSYSQMREFALELINEWWKLFSLPDVSSMAVRGGRHSSSLPGKDSQPTR
jgi:hypothetical protein